MKQRYWLFKRRQTFYVQDAITGEQKSLGTKDRAEANRLLEFKRQSHAEPGFRQLLLRACAGSDPLLAERKWQAVMDQMLTHGKEPTRARCKRAFASASLNRIRNVKLLETTADDFLAVLNSCPCSINHYLKRLHNLALGLGWLPARWLESKRWLKHSTRWPTGTLHGDGLATCPSFRCPGMTWALDDAAL